MKRRDFFTASGAGFATLATTATISAQPDPIGLVLRRQTPRTAREFIEVRKYTVKDADKRAKFVEILDNALIPALNRQEIKPVGVFEPIPRDPKYALNVFVVIPHKTTETFVNVNAKLVADAVYRKDAAPIFETNSKDPVYTDCETFLLKGFATAPALEVPQLGPDRVFELRLYRSFNIERNDAKIKMFDEGGELPLFREIGLQPIFFGEIIAGTRMPALLYMIGCPSLEKHAEVWRVFGQHPKWQEIRGNPAYADTATEIDNVILTPSSGSQI